MPSPSPNKVGVPNEDFGAQYRACTSTCQRLTSPLPAPAHDSVPQRAANPFRVEEFHLQCPAGFVPALWMSMTAGPSGPTQTVTVPTPSTASWVISENSSVPLLRAKAPRLPTPTVPAWTRQVYRLGSDSASNHHQLDLKQHQGIAILTASDALKRIA